METPALLKLKHDDIGALIVSCLAGLLIGSAIPDPTWAAYTAILVCDHLFLGWLVFMGEDGARRPLPIAVIISTHLAFVVLVIVVVAARHALPYFRFFPYPMAAFALWLLSSAVGYDTAGEEPAGLHRVRSSSQGPLRQRPKRSLRSRLGASDTEESEPAIKLLRPANSSARQETQRAASSVQSQPGMSAPEHAAANSQEHPHPAKNGYKPVVSGIALEPQPSTNPGQQAPEFYHDNSIAESLRKKHSEQDARHNPILGASAEDHEEWLRSRGLENPTHRKAGMSVREEYEQWLIARAAARTGEPPAA
jgi:hypothetical protein